MVTGIIKQNILCFYRIYIFLCCPILISNVFNFFLLKGGKAFCTPRSRGVSVGLLQEKILLEISYMLIFSSKMSVVFSRKLSIVLPQQVNKTKSKGKLKFASSSRPVIINFMVMAECINI